MSKNICSIGLEAPAKKSVLREAAGFALWVWAGVDPAAPPTTARPRPGPVLHRLPDLRKFGPSFR